MSNEIDLLMDTDPTKMSTKDIDSIIRYMREQRKGFEKGIRPKKAEGPKKSLDSLMKLVRKEPEVPPEPMKRRSF